MSFKKKDIICHRCSAALLFFVFLQTSVLWKRLWFEACASLSHWLARRICVRILHSTTVFSLKYSSVSDHIIPVIWLLRTTSHILLWNITNILFGFSPLTQLTFSKPNNVEICRYSALTCVGTVRLDGRRCFITA